MTTATPSEFALFQKLANPQKTDFARKQNAFKNAVQKELSTVQPKPSSFPFQPPKQAPLPPVAVSTAVSKPPPPSTRKKHDSDTETQSSSSRSSSSSSYYRRRRQEKEGERSRDGDRDRDRDAYSRGNSYGGGGGGTGGSGDSRGDGRGAHGFSFPLHDDNEDVERELRAEVDREKQGYLLELMKYKEPPYNIKLTREYTMDDPLDVIQFECDRIKTNLDTVNNVTFIRETAIFAFQGIELANRQWGPVLQLDGWADSVKEDKERYNHVIERLYKKHWRYGNMSPEAELAWLLGSSMVMHHLKMKYGGGVRPSDSKKGGGSSPSKFDPMSMLGALMPNLGGMKNMMGGGGGPSFGGPSGPSANGPPLSGRPVMKGPTPPSSSSAASTDASAAPWNARPVMRGPGASAAAAPPHVNPQQPPSMPPPSMSSMPPAHAPIPPMPPMHAGSFGTVMGPPPTNQMMRPGDRNPDVDVLTEARRAAEKEIRDMQDRARAEHVALQREMHAMRMEMRSMQQQHQPQHQQQQQRPPGLPVMSHLPPHQTPSQHSTLNPAVHRQAAPMPSMPPSAPAVHFDNDDSEEDDDKQISIVGFMNRRGGAGAGAGRGAPMPSAQQPLAPAAAAAPLAKAGGAGRGTKKVAPLKLDLGAVSGSGSDDEESGEP